VPKKVLWLVNDTNADGVLARAQLIGAFGVCIRTTNTWLPAQISRFHDNGFRVYGWRLAAVSPNPGSPHHFVDDEAQYVVSTLIPRGLDGYITDPEEAGTSTWNWNYHDPHIPLNLKKLARRWCDPIQAAGRAANANFHFGLSSGWHMPTNCPHLPWSTFVSYSDAHYPQCYWYGDEGYQHGSTPKAAYDGGMHSWGTIANGKALVPMFGHIGSDVKHGYVSRTQQQAAQEFANCASVIEDNALDEVHFYSYVHGVATDVWHSIRDL
jgi:hypothetical protein